MEIREFAERVLFATALEEKLASPESKLTDLSPGRALASPLVPGRPEELAFDRSGVRSARPSVSQLGDDEDRGLLLHFFANHELLAAELMALVLLKFPEAPEEFRAGVAKTLQEEQMHTRLYAKRLNECGVPFGSQPVNGFFWDAVSSMETPADYVSRLSLTFEQANLDYSRYFARVFAEAGDHQTAKILDRIYRDEIGHVGYGLEWFRKWKAPGDTDWQSFRKRLVFPLSPSRAKGRGWFNRSGREEVGLDADFINHLEVFTQSKGRTPNVYHFNPQAEFAIAAEAQGHCGQANPKLVETLARDLSSLSLFLTRQDDIAILDRVPSLGFLQKLGHAGFHVPEIQERAVVSLEGRKLNELRPWAWSPDTAWLESLFTQVSQQSSGWRPRWRELHSKAFSTRLGKEAGFGRGWVCRTPVEVRAISGQVVWKSPYGVAGQGLRFVDGSRCSREDEAWRDEVLQKYGELVVEPAFDRVLDFSVQYDSEMRLLGYVHLHNDARGKFHACVMRRALPMGGDAELRRFFYSQNRHVERFYEETFPELMRPHLSRVGYAGPLGVDAMIARETDGSLVHHPIIEINPRYTMGRVAVELYRHVVKGETMRFEILSRRHLKQAGLSSFEEFAAVLEGEAPLDLVTYQNGRRCLRAGTLVLNDPCQAEQFLAVLRVGQDVDSLHG